MLARRTEQIASFIVMDVLERANEMERQGHDIVHLEVGEPDFDAPECVKEAVTQAIAEGCTHYTHSLGDIGLREAICEHYAEQYGVSVSPDQVIVSSGTSPVMMMLFSALVDVGNEVILSNPRYACYPNMVRFAQGVPVDVPVYEEDGFQLSADAVREHINERTRAVVINSPSNPTGTLLAAERMAALADLGIPIISDEIYHGLVYAGREHSVLEFSEDAFVLNGFSKLYAMTGLRMGYLIAPNRYVDTIRKLQQNFFICANSAVQKGALAALQCAGPDVARMKRVYDSRRRFMIDGLRRLGFGIASEPTGAFYVFANAKHLGSDSYSLAFDILEKARVGVTPGTDFGSRGEGYLRFSYAASIERITEGMERIGRYLERYHAGAHE